MVGWWCDSRPGGAGRLQSCQVLSGEGRTPVLLILEGFFSDETSRPIHDSFRAMPCQWKGSRVRNPLGWVSARRDSAQSHDSSRVSFVSLRFYSLTPAAQHNRVGRAGGPVPLGDGALDHLRGSSWTDGTMDLVDNGLTRERHNVIQRTRD